MDTLSRLDRSRRMALVKNKGTRPEIAVRKAVSKLGHRYRLHKATLPGKPDLVFSSSKKVIFVHGCFWHRHPHCPRNRTPKSRLEFWIPKLKSNRARDKKNIARLSKMGWNVLVVWECDSEKPKPLIRTLRKFLAKR